MRIILHAGPGGSGTTTVAAATALAVARRGQRVVLAGVEDVQDLRRVLGVTPGEALPDNLRVAAAPLSAPTREWGQAQETVLGLLARGGLDPALAEDAPWLPGLGQARALLRLLDLVQRDDSDVLVLDAGPLRQVSELLTLPGRLVWNLRRLMAAQPALLTTLRPSIVGMGLPAGAVIRVVSQLLARLETLGEVLRTEQTRVRLVMGEPRRSLSQLAAQLPALCVAGVSLDQVIANGADHDAAAVIATGTHELVADARVSSLPRQHREPEGQAALTELVEGTALALMDSAVVSLAPVVTRVEGGYQWRAPMGFADAGQVRVHRRQDDLLVTTGGRRHVLPLSAGLRRCAVVKAAVADRCLLVHFVPDPAAWVRRD